MRQDVQKKITRAVCAVVVLIIVVMLGISSVYSITEQEQAVVTTFGVPSAVDTPGLHFKVPFIQNVTKVDTTIKGLSVGYDMATGASLQDESLMITLDYNFVNVDFFIEYKVIEPIKALYASEDPVMILKNVAQSYIRSTVGSFNVDDVITSGKNEIQASIKEKIVERLEREDIGIALINITIQDAEPPTEEVMEAFKAVETAKQGMETAINNANKYKNEQEPAAEARIDQISKEAAAQAQARINEANGQVSRFNDLYAEYIKNPMITKQRMYYEAMEDVMPGLKIIIDNSKNGTQKILPLEPIVGE
jgi:membrane protease subunit HflK